MAILQFSKVTSEDLKQYIDLYERDAPDSPIFQVDDIAITELEQQRVNLLQLQLINEKIHIFNEATIWARAIYPLLIIAERDDIRALAEVSLQAKYPKFELQGIADGVLGRSVSGRSKAPHLVVIETKRGIENVDPLYQLYAQLLAAAQLNRQLQLDSNASPTAEPQEVFGCYTIADSWTFVHGQVGAMESDRPTLRVESSREYTEKVDAETILKILKKILDRAPKIPSF